MILLINVGPEMGERERGDVGHLYMGDVLWRLDLIECGC